MKKIDLNTKRIISSAVKKSAEGDADTTNIMLDPRYLRQSSSLIQDALQKGFDVLQLASGDIVTTGTKTVVHQYSWDTEKGKLVKSKTDAGRKRRSSSASDTEEELESTETDA